ncbi:synaptonemal complex central element protein 1-like isoform X1 [Neophocaena asiaeorientalis asiaeorientalis]|uniref:Synaptonemal complex central element protein 1-like isoform X1 n=1 Tax=Neophocaena asiaeorientalis asiaeorientalis TaxID=1706337 RepID=A0A341AP44_NEOAA|nr:synaptonemal complex central element protein 1-like isoform X1 [Neophocaena asiaeorientalis asiaeorientalis]
MAGKLDPSKAAPPVVLEEAEGQTKASKKTEELLEMVKKLQKEGSLEPQVEDLINRINELQQAKKKSSEELGEAQALWEALRRDLDSLNGEKVHLEEVLSKKQEALRTLQLHCQRKESEAQRKYMLAEHMEQISIHNSQITESQGQRKPGLHVEERLEDLTSQHKDPWEFHMLKQRLAWEIRALQSSKEQLLTEERQARAKLETVERRLRSPSEVQSAPAEKDGLKAELEKLGGQVPAQTQTTPDDRAGEVESPGWRPDGPKTQRAGSGIRSPSERGVCGCRASSGRWGQGKGGAGQRGRAPGPQSLTLSSRRPAPSSPARATWRRRRSWP